VVEQVRPKTRSLRTPKESAKSVNLLARKASLTTMTTVVAQKLKQKSPKKKTVKRKISKPQLDDAYG
jgi:hypothetical protein